VEGRDGGDGHLGEDGLRELIVEHAEREPNWRQRPYGLLRQLFTRITELHGDELSDDIAMLLIGSRN
jgi:hypothetical protein